MFGLGVVSGTMVHQRYCSVPGCLSSSKRNPSKYFFTVPIEFEERKKWLDAMRRSSTDLSDKTHLDICEDHFNLEEDLENYVRFKYYGGKTKMKRGVVPHIFHYLPVHQVALPPYENGLKRPRQPTLEDILIANKMLKLREGEEDDFQDVFDLPPFHAFDQSLEEEAAETLLLLSRDIRNG